MRAFCGCLALIFLSAAPLLAGESSWTPVPSQPGIEIPGTWMMTPDPAISYAYGRSGLQRTDDGGRHWRKVDGPGVGYTLDPHDPETLFAVSYEHLLRSEDGGRSWAVTLQVERSPFAYYDHLKVLASAHFPGRVYAATREALWRSNDGGKSFAPRGAMPGYSEESPNFELAEAADGGLYLRRYARCGMYGCGGDRWRVDRSPDQGQSWIAVASGDAPTALFAVLPHPTRPESVYFLAKSLRLAVSDDRGASFTERPEPVPAYQLFTDAAAPDALYTFSARRLYRSGDRGITWNQLVLPINSEAVEYASFAHLSPGRLGYYQISLLMPGVPPLGSYESGDGGVNWTKLAVAGPFSEEVYDLAASGSEGSLYLLADAGQSIRRSHDGGASWQSTDLVWRFSHLTGDPLDGDTFYVASTLGEQRGILRSTNAGVSYQMVLDNGATTGVSDLVSLVRNGQTTLVAALTSDELARSTDGGASWTVGPPQIVGAPPDQIRRLQTDGLRIYGFSSYNSQYYVSVDGGATFTHRGSGSDRMAAGGGLVARLGFGTIEVSADGGVSWQARDLPFPVDLVTTDLRADSGGAFYLIGDGFLLRSRDRGRSWQSLSQDLPVARNEIVLADPADPGHLYLGGSQGLYQGNFRDPSRLSLVRGRFEARLRWRTVPQAAWTYGEASSITDQTGVFRLFSPERAEVAVQMLDGRVLGGRFWTFVASMTDVELEVEVEDRLTGDTWVHHQPAGQALSTANFGAFPRQDQPTGGALLQPFGGLPASAEAVTLAGRFEVSASRPLPYAFPPQGRQLFADTVAFTFFDPGAIDLIVNVIDGRPLNGKFWIFAGSLTDQEFAITVRDVLTGAVKTYPNPVGGFAGFGDVDAF
jgi:photosystem II stability/assembly factor-like uncharacterized protein